ncbi:MAG: phospholipase D/Transphosphatidylase [Phycisphaerales bacterium]|nr:phospholipase D/Transphosphatidylase [Phycisphaerales bacterium]MDB5354969.1 phospholipase D/Transphosphatidylase [Phycisphaerales bacterium]
MRPHQSACQPKHRPLWAVILVALLLSSGGCASNNPAVYKIKVDYTVHDPQFAQVMGNLLGPPLVPGNACTTLLNGDEIFPAMLGAIRSAQKTITFETYIYWSGAIGREFTDVLSERARAGVKVHVMLDWLGSGRINHEFLKTMTEAGVEVCEYHPFHPWDPATYRQINNRTHRKLLIVDGKIGFTGGVGIADEWDGHAQDPNHWRDNHYCIEGPIVAQLQAAFLDNWMKSTGEVLAGEGYFPPLPNDGKLRAQVFKSSSNSGSESMELMMLLSIAAAGKNIRMESAYFVPNSLTRDYLLAARRRGVSVEIIVPGPTIDEKVVRQASHATWGELLKAGVKIYEYQPTMFHCKQMIVDSEWVSIGSSNLDNRSFRLNDEANLNVLDAKFAAGQIKVFEDDKRHSREFTYEMWNHRPLGEKISEQFASILSWLL